MIYTFAFVLVILWLLGLFIGFGASSFIHILLVFALVMALANFVSGRNSRL